MFPSIWLDDINSASDWAAKSKSFADTSFVLDAIDDRLLTSRHPFNMNAWCTVCESTRSMLVTWDYCGVNSGSVNPAWTETAVCSSCGLNSRMRALYGFLSGSYSPIAGPRIYLAEQVTPFFKMLKSRYVKVTGSEYLGDNIPGGKRKRVRSHLVRHEDLTHLSFSDASFDLVISQDIFEHIPDYKSAFAECFRVLNSTGHLIFTIPFFPNLELTEVRAKLTEGGAVTHILEPEYHGNPVAENSLCFQHFGWDLLDDLRNAGFSQAVAKMYWGPWQGHIGIPSFIFHASV